MTTKTKLVTKESLAELLRSAEPKKVQQIVGRALLVIYENQMEDEKRSGTAAYANGIGFTVGDATIGCSNAAFFKANGYMGKAVIAYWTEIVNGYPRICKYDKQLNEAASAKQRYKDEKS